MSTVSNNNLAPVNLYEHFIFIRMSEHNALVSENTMLKAQISLLGQDNIALRGSSDVMTLTIENLRMENEHLRKELTSTKKLLEEHARRFEKIDREKLQRELHYATVDIAKDKTVSLALPSHIIDRLRHERNEDAHPYYHSSSTPLSDSTKYAMYAKYAKLLKQNPSLLELDEENDDTNTALVSELIQSIEKFLNDKPIIEGQINKKRLQKFLE
jgi:glucose-6-phosphate-specific signal transduction histidine kinase